MEIIAFEKRTLIYLYTFEFENLKKSRSYRKMNRNVFKITKTYLNN